MATQFDVIYTRALAKITDYDILKLEPSLREQIMREYLRSAQVEFQRLCKEDLADRDDTLAQYNQDLSDEVIEILATGVAYYWLCPKVLNTENLYNVLNTKDFSMYSPASLLREIQALRDSLWKEFKRKMYDYAYQAADIAGLNV